MANQDKPQNPATTAAKGGATPEAKPSAYPDMHFDERVHAASVSPALPCPGGATAQERARAAIELVNAVNAEIEASRA